MPDGKGVLVLARSRATHFNEMQIQFISYPDGKITPVTRDTNSYSDLSVDSSGKILATVLSEGRWNRLIAGANPAPVDGRSLSPADMFTNFTWTNDRRTFYDKANAIRWVNPDTGAQGTIADRKSV